MDPRIEDESESESTRVGFLGRKELSRSTWSLLTSKRRLAKRYKYAQEVNMTPRRMLNSEQYPLAAQSPSRFANQTATRPKLTTLIKEWSISTAFGLSTAYRKISLSPHKSFSRQSSATCKYDIIQRSCPGSSFAHGSRMCSTRVSLINTLSTLRHPRFSNLRQKALESFWSLHGVGDGLCSRTEPSAV